MRSIYEGNTRSLSNILSFQLHQPNRCQCRWLFFAIVILSVILTIPSKESNTAYAQTILSSYQSVDGQTFSKQMSSLYNNLIKLPEQKSNRIFGKYTPIIARELNMNNLHFTTYQDLKKLLNLAADESIDVLTLFTLPVLQQTDNKALVLDREMLSRLNLDYNLHGIFLISTPSADDNAIVHMNFLITGQGKLIVGYDKNATIKHPEYSFASGKYDYQELFVMDARADDSGNYGLFDIKGLSSPNDRFKPMTGPLNVDIRSLSIPPETGNKKSVLVRYELVGPGKKIVARIPIEKLFKAN